MEATEKLNLKKLENIKRSLRNGDKNVYDVIEELAQLLNSAIDKMDEVLNSTEGSISEAENERVAAENARVLAETEREQAEDERAAAELDRESRISAIENTLPKKANISNTGKILDNTPLSVKVTLNLKNESEEVISTTDIEAATKSAAGVMSTTDKRNLDSISRPQFEVFADSACTTVPDSATAYNTLYLRVNVPLSVSKNDRNLTVEIGTNETTIQLLTNDEVLYEGAIALASLPNGTYTLTATNPDDAYGNTPTTFGSNISSRTAALEKSVKSKAESSDLEQLARTISATPTASGVQIDLNGSDGLLSSDTIPFASTTAGGAMSAEDKRKLEDIESASLENLKFEDTVASGDKTTKVKRTLQKVIGEGDDTEINPIASFEIPAATTSKAGVMSAADKNKLDSLFNRLINEIEFDDPNYTTGVIYDDLNTAYLANVEIVVYFEDKWYYLNEVTSTAFVFSRIDPTTFALETFTIANDNSVAFASTTLAAASASA